MRLTKAERDARDQAIRDAARDAGLVIDRDFVVRNIDHPMAQAAIATAPASHRGDFERPRGHRMAQYLVAVLGADGRIRLVKAMDV